MQPVARQAATWVRNEVDVHRQDVSVERQDVVVTELVMHERTLRVHGREGEAGIGEVSGLGGRGWVRDGQAAVWRCPPAGSLGQRM